MSYTVSSGYAARAQRSTADFKRRLTIAGSDYSSRVERWPTFTSIGDRITAGDISFDIANTDGVFSHWTQNPALMQSAVEVSLGFDYAVGSTEYLTLFSGTVDSFRLRGGKFGVSALNKFSRLMQRAIGSPGSAQAYTSSNHAASDLAWYIISSHGGLDGTKSAANTDVDWAAYTSWTAANSASAMLLNANFTGQRAVDALDRLADLTRSLVFIEGAKLKFVIIPTSAQTSVYSYGNSTVIADEVLYDKRSIFNRYFVSAQYNVSSRSFATQVVAANSSSVNSFGAREVTVGDTAVWHADSGSASRFAQFMADRFGAAVAQAEIESPLCAAFVGVGDTITFVNSQSNIQGRYAVTQETIDLEGATKTIRALFLTSSL